MSDIKQTNILKWFSIFVTPFVFLCKNFIFFSSETVIANNTTVESLINQLSNWRTDPSNEQIHFLRQNASPTLTINAPNSGQGVRGHVFQARNEDFVLFFSPIHGQEQIFHSSYLILFQISIFQVFSNFDIK